MKRIVGTWVLHLIINGSQPRSLRSLAPLARPPLCYALPLAPLARSARSLALVLRAPRGGATLSTRSARSLRSLARPCATRSPRRCYALHSLRSLATLARSPLCYARSSAPLRSPLALLGGRFGAAGLPPRFARPPPRRVALPLRGLLVRPAPLRLAPWRPLSLRGVRGSPKALPVPRGLPRPCGGRGLQPPPPSSPLAGGYSPPFPLAFFPWCAHPSSPPAPHPLPLTPSHTPRG